MKLPAKAFVVDHYGTALNVEPYGKQVLVQTYHALDSDTGAYASITNLHLSRQDARKLIRRILAAIKGAEAWKRGEAVVRRAF